MALSRLATPGGSIPVGVTVTFMRMDSPPPTPRLVLPLGVEVQARPRLTVPEYRALYEGVGAQYCWWLRRVMPDRELEAVLRAAAVAVHTLHEEGRVAGFYELDRSAWPVVNLNYFGLLPHAIGRGLGTIFLRHAVETAFGAGARAMTVNTCTADHPRALPNYLRAGFRVVRTVNEVWQVPERLGLPIPEHLRLDR
jgi:GNAT superfamily N-acetyltransferase